MHLTVCSYHVTYTLQSESTVYSYLNVKELLALSRCEIWRLRDCNWTRTHNHLFHKRALNHLAKLAKWLSCIVSTYLYGAFGCIRVSPLYSCLNVKALLKLQISRLLRARSFLTFRQLWRGVLKRISTIKGYVQGTLRKKQLIVSFLKHFTENDENTICIVFQFQNPKLS